MKYIAFILTLVLSMAFTGTAADAAKKEAKSGKLYHVVSFKFKETASKEQVQQVETAFKGLKKKIKQIQSLEWGTNVSPEKLDKGFTHCWVLTFKSAADRDAYLVHPDHKEFGKLVGPVLGDVFVIDFVAEK